MDIDISMTMDMYSMHFVNDFVYVVSYYNEHGKPKIYLPAKTGWIYLCTLSIKFDMGAQTLKSQCLCMGGIVFSCIYLLHCMLPLLAFLASLFGLLGHSHV